MSDPRHLEPGCRCYVRMPDGIRVRGVFKGYALVGETNALVFETIAGTTRLIPDTQIIHIDVLEWPNGDRPRAKSEGGDGYYHG